MVKRSIVWFKTDLRLHDNKTLVKAIAQSDGIIPVYCFDDTHYKTTNFGFKKTGCYRAQFILEAVCNLKDNLQKLNSDLLVLHGNPEVELSKIVKEFNVKTVFAQEEITNEEKLTQNKVEKELFNLDCSLQTYQTNTLYQFDNLPFNPENAPDVFTNFRKAVEKDCIIGDMFEAPKQIKSPKLPLTILPDLNALQLESTNTDVRSAFPFKGGETEALDRLSNYFYNTKSILTYKETRNGMVGDSYSTKFSAWLALGCISAKKIIAELKVFEEKHEANTSTYWLFFELLWRDYFKLMMVKHGNRFFLRDGISGLIKAAKPLNKFALKKWIDGKTGNDFIDANMIELKKTGFMSNRGRQNVASYFCNDLNLDWRYGAAYFEEQLIDYDVCSNWGNWAYLAGVGNDPRSNRYFNIEKQASVYDPNATFRKLWLTKK
ncbi:DASH family cryptochrome [Pedobacter changchengzhani]|uniref:Cryptochrome DASH n=1 Tax=Pedobacter changchengzhani TaxID=2529274 RepID=A0A4V2ZZV6_9SPHI|nr:DASH family cryptochrome [Pedobacter changchengzhani]TDG35213.1 DASH family cryptochrome [Pedobacter changchengzhani]